MHIVLGILANKDADEIVTILQPHALSLTFVPVGDHDHHDPASLPIASAVAPPRTSSTRYAPPRPAPDRGLALPRRRSARAQRRAARLGAQLLNSPIAQSYIDAWAAGAAVEPFQTMLDFLQHQDRLPRLPVLSSRAA